MTEHLDPDLQRFRILIRQWHAGHPRLDQVEHCEHVMSWLEQALDREPHPIPARRDMLLAALGHDLYEDSAIPPVDIVADYGAWVDRLIRRLTERADGLPAYVEQVASGPEEARLIKLCDGIDNYGGLVGSGLVQSDPATWVAVVRSKMEPMFSRLEAVPFQQYSRAGEWLSQTLKETRERFWTVVEALLGEWRQNGTVGMTR